MVILQQAKKFHQNFECKGIKMIGNNILCQIGIQDWELGNLM